MKRILYVMAMFTLAAPLHAQNLSSIVDPPVPNVNCGNQDGYDTQFKEGENFDPTMPFGWGKCFNDTYVWDISDLGKFVNARIDATFIKFGIPDNNPSFIFVYLAAPNGCLFPNQLLASVEWHQVFQDPLKGPDSYINGYISCYGISCGYDLSDDFYGSEYAPRDPIVHGDPSC